MPGTAPPALVTRSDLTISSDTISSDTTSDRGDVEGELARDLVAWTQRWDVEPVALQRLVEGAVSGAPVDSSIGAPARSDLARIVERAGRALLAG